MDNIVQFFTLVAAFLIGVSGVRMIMVYINNRDADVSYLEQKLIPWILVLSISLFWLLIAYLSF